MLYGERLTYNSASDCCNMADEEATDFLCIFRFADNAWVLVIG